MDFSASTVLLLIAATVLMTALIWVGARSIPRTRGLLQAETARLDAASRTRAAALLAGRGAAAGWALASGVAFYLVFRTLAFIWLRARIRTELETYYIEANEHQRAFDACLRLTASRPGTSDAEVQRCLDSLGTTPSGPPEVNDALPMLLGWLAPLAAALICLGVLAVLLARRRSAMAGAQRPRSAQLRSRGMLSFGPRWAMAIPAAAAALLGGLLLVTGLSSSHDDWGRYTRLLVLRNVGTPGPEGGYGLPLNHETTQVPFPGWFYGIPLVLVALTLLLVTAYLLRSMAQAPRPDEHQLFGVDDLARTLSAKFVAGIAGAGILAALGPVAINAGGAMLTVAGDLRLVNGEAEFFYHESLLSGIYLAIVGYLVCLLALLMLVLALAAAIELSAARKLAVAVALNEEVQGTSS